MSEHTVSSSMMMLIATLSFAFACIGATVAFHIGKWVL
jgi:hypothetical protein